MVSHHVRGDDQCLLMRLRRHGEVVGYVPLVARTVPLLGWRIQMLQPLSEDSNTHSDLLLRDTDDATLTAVVSALLQLDIRWDCFRMGRLLDHTPLAIGLESALREARLPHVSRDGQPAYTLPLPDSYDAYLANRSSKFRNYLKRIGRKLQAAGTLEVKHVSTAADFEPGYEALLQVEKASWKEDHGSSITAVPRQHGFYRDLAREALAAGRLHLHWLELDAKPVAYNLGFIGDAGYHYLKTSYDASLKALSPATFLRARLIAELIDGGIRHLDFPGEPYEWETQWTEEIRWRRILSAYRSTVLGRTLAAVERVRHRPQGSRRVEHIDPRSQSAVAPAPMSTGDGD
jgi:CelD/BcsL family acetyltransferase involved in cellulose biosynthesis